MYSLYTLFYSINWRCWNTDKNWYEQQTKMKIKKKSQKTIAKPEGIGTQKHEWICCWEEEKIKYNKTKKNKNRSKHNELFSRNFFCCVQCTIFDSNTFCSHKHTHTKWKTWKVIEEKEINWQKVGWKVREIERHVRDMIRGWTRVNIVNNIRVCVCVSGYSKKME